MKRNNQFTDRTGEKGITNEGQNVTIIKYINANNLVVQFEDGVIKDNVTYSSFLKGGIRKPIDRRGMVFPTNSCGDIEIIDHEDNENYTIKFLEDGTIVDKIEFGNIVKGAIKNHNKISVYGVGYIGYGKYGAEKSNKIYSFWVKMLQRCYSESQRFKNMTYKDCVVHKHWHNFQNFAEWATNKYKTEIMDKWELDKDILFKGNKIYSQEACCIVPKVINGVFKNPSKKKSGLPFGIVANGRYFKVRLSINNERAYLGTFRDLKEACQVYKEAKEKRVREIADEWKPLIEPEVYQAMYNYTVDYENI